MCFIKDVVWDEEDVVIQYHPQKSEYVTLHGHCLHLWRPVGIEVRMARNMHTLTEVRKRMPIVQPEAWDRRKEARASRVSRPGKRLLSRVV